MDEDGLQKIIIGFWKNLILHNLGKYLLIDGLLSVLLFVLFNIDSSILFAMWLGGIPRYIAGAAAGAKSLAISMNEVSKQK